MFHEFIYEFGCTKVPDGDERPPGRFQWATRVTVTVSRAGTLWPMPFNNGRAPPGAGGHGDPRTDSEAVRVSDQGGGDS